MTRRSASSDLIELEYGPSPYVLRRAMSSASNGIIVVSSPASIFPKRLTMETKGEQLDEFEITSSTEGIPVTIANSPCLKGSDRRDLLRLSTSYRRKFTYTSKRYINFMHTHIYIMILLINILIDVCYHIYYYKQSSNDLTGISRKKSPPHLVSLIKVDPHNHSSWYEDSAYVHVATFIILSL